MSAAVVAEPFVWWEDAPEEEEPLDPDELDYELVPGGCGEEPGFSHGKWWLSEV